VQFCHPIVVIFCQPACTLSSNGTGQFLKKKDFGTTALANLL
jgi:heme/copper-type cytochrome/quinol oxidase subunit 1